MSVKKPFDKFSKENDLILIEFVRKHPILVPYTRGRTPKADHRADLWKKLANYLEIPPRQCKMRWYHMRNSYHHALHQNKKYMYSDLLKPLLHHQLLPHNEKRQTKTHSSDHKKTKGNKNIIREVIPVADGNDEIVFHVKIGDASRRRRRRRRSEDNFANTNSLNCRHTTARRSTKVFVIVADKVAADVVDDETTKLAAKDCNEVVFDINDCDENNPNNIKVLGELENQEIRDSESLSLLESSDNEEPTVVVSKNKPDENIVKSIKDEWSDNNSDDEAELGYSITLVKDEPITVIDD